LFQQINGLDYLDYLSYMYRFFRGGLRYKFFFTNTPVSSTNTFNSVYFQTSIFQNGSTYNNIDQGPSHITYPKLNPVHEVTVPYYSQYRKLPISVSPGERVMTLQYYANNAMGTKVLRSGADDFSYGWLMGTPQLSFSLPN